jgi:asparagine synthase (glutamine-hydrolysing)
MCGIAGIIKHACHSDKWRWVLKSAADALVHRGPDDSGIWFDEKAGVGLAHRRLSIIDISNNGRQPMVSFSGRFVVVYNGEIYNYNRLRKEIDQKCQIIWQSTSDTEVMLASFDLWGVEKAVTKFIGMFAFALWDRKERLLYLCRDRMGIKPLYYGLYGNTFLFGSELKALKKHPDFKSEIDRNSLALYMRYNCIPAPNCIYKNTYKLEPGKLLKVNVDGHRYKLSIPEQQAYWSAKNIVELSKSKENRRESKVVLVQRLEDILKEAVSIRMISDVPLGVFLSGGIDSSTIAALMQVQSPVPVKTFSIGFEEEEYNEALYARSVANYLGTEHTELYVRPNEAMDVIPDLPHLYDEPFGDCSQIPTYLLSKLTCNYVKVCLSGDGGDELFGGYNRYHWVPKIRYFQKNLPRYIAKLVATTASIINPAIWDRLFRNMSLLLPRNYRFSSIGNKIHKLATAFSCISYSEIYYCLVSHWFNPEKVVLQSTEPVTKITNTSEYPLLDDHIQLMMYLDMVTYLPDDILTKVDRASMGASLEARVPFLDHRVVEMAWQLPLEMKICDGVGKSVLRQILYKYVPKELIERPKTGFSIPLDSWLRGPLRDWADSLLNSKKIKSQGFLDHEIIEKTWKIHLSGKRNQQYKLWDILMFQAWLETN